MGVISSVLVWCANNLQKKKVFQVFQWSSYVVCLSVLILVRARKFAEFILGNLLAHSKGEGEERQRESREEREKTIIKL